MAANRPVTNRALTARVGSRTPTTTAHLAAGDSYVAPRLSEDTGTPKHALGLAPEPGPRSAAVSGGEAQLADHLPPQTRDGDAYMPPRISLEAEANYQRWLASLRPWEPSQGSREYEAHAGRPVRDKEALSGEREHTAGGHVPARAGSVSGGQAVLERYGEQFFSAIGARGGQAVVHERGPEYLQQIGAKGGEATRRKYGPEHYAAIGRKGGQAGRGRRRRRTSPDQLALPIDQPQ